MSSTKNEIISGITYSAISKYLGIAISLIVTGILARLISPADFGVVAIATVLIIFFGMLSDLGIAPAIIQKKDLNKNELTDIFSFTMWTALITSVCFFLFSWVIADYYDAPILVPICQLLSVNLFFSALNIVPNALLLKNKEFRFIAFRSLIVQFIGGAISVIAALYGAGLYALLINPIFSSIIIFTINFKKHPLKLKRTFGLASMRKIYQFSSYQFFFNIINYFSRNLDKLLIGKYLNLSALGYYEKSYRLMMLPLQNITHVITPVMHPVFSEFQNDLKHLSWSYLRIVRLLAFIGFSLSTFLWFTARELIVLIFGTQWDASVPVFQILSLTVGIQIILSTSGSIFQAANDTKSLFISGLLSAILSITGMMIGIFIFKSLEAVAWSISFSFLINFIQCYVLMYKFTLKLSMLPFWRQFISPVTLCLILTVLLFFGSKLTHDLDFLISFFIKAFLSLVIFICYIQFSKEYNILEKVRSLTILNSSTKK
ncbi:MAG: lipopolysaccharide biosynthesis protein [Prolixibacteraceae bacterium]